LVPIGKICRPLMTPDRRIFGFGRGMKLALQTGKLLRRSLHQLPRQRAPGFKMKL
jgi:hypothetical protein